MKDAVYLDTETTNVEDAEVIELAFQPVGEDTYSVTKRFCPSKPISVGATLVHGILFEDVKGEAPVSTLRQHLPPHTYWIGHNIDFDWKACGSPAYVKRIDTLPIARKHFPDANSHKLGAIFLYLYGATRENLDYLKSAHAALFDVQLLDRVLPDLLALKGLTHLMDDAQALWEYSEFCRIPDVMTFGKHRGLTIKEVPAGYAAWYRKQPDTDPYLLEAFRRAGK